MKKLIKLAAVACCFVFAFSGCAAKEQKIIKESDETFQFGAFYTPFNGESGSPPFGAQPTDNTLENWQVMADSGITTALPIYDTSHEMVLTSLKNAADAGVKVLVWDYGNPGIYNTIYRNPNATYSEVRNLLEENTEEIRARIDQYTEFESFAGIHAYDEPSMDYYNAIAACQDWWYENYPEYEFYVNLFPSYASASQLYGSSVSADYTYRDYVERFVQTVNPSVISYDHYALQRSGFMGIVRPQWLSDLEVFAQAAKDYRIPFRMYILTTQHWSYIAPEYYREIAWQAYSAMCYGVSGLNFFTYWGYLIPDNNVDNLGTGLVGPRGEITPCYYACQEVMKEIKSFEGLYLSFDWEGTMLIGESGNGTYRLVRDPLEELYGVRSVQATEDALIGQFVNEDDCYAYMVMNYALPFDNASNTVTLEFENCSKVLVCKKGKRFVETLENDTLTMTLGSGEGYFVIPIV